MSYSRPNVLVGLVAVVLVGLGAIFAIRFIDRDADVPLEPRPTRDTVDGKRPDENSRDAEPLAPAPRTKKKENGEALLIAARTAAEQNRVDEALEYLAQIPDDATEFAIEGHRLAASLEFYRRQQLGASERHFRRVLEMNPNDPVANPALAYLLVISGRRWESARHLLATIQQKRFTHDQLCWLGVLEAVVDGSDELRDCRRANPEDVLPLLGLARLAIRDNHLPEAEQLLRQVVAAAPVEVEAHVRLGYLAVDSGSENDWAAWRKALPPDADAHPDIWMIRGLMAHRAGDDKGFVRCLLETVRRDPDHEQATYQLSQAFVKLGEPELAAQFAKRTTLLAELADTIHTLQTSQKDTDSMRRAVGLLQELGRIWEAWAWCIRAFEVQPQLAWPKEVGARLETQVKPGAPRTLPSAAPTTAIELTRYPLPDWRKIASATPSAGNSAADLTQLRFRNVAASVGLEFRYENGRDPAKEGTRMFEFTGGGAAVLDYDLDGWPDVYLTQGSKWPPNENQTSHLDQLHRNVHGKSENVTPPSSLFENGFSQGVTVGDFDNDGFPDIYVANIGRNRLFHNLGDGTFEDITATSGLASDRWTSSCLMADLNGDGLPDIYDVNYLKGDDIFDRVCRYLGPIARICPPRLFDAEDDQVYVNQGDGTFVEMSADAGVESFAGKGMGIVAADFDQSGRLSLFVANDQVRNSFLKNETSSPGGVLRFREDSLLMGLAVDEKGRAQACMGVAVGDVNQDDLLDLFITNFYNESNCLYEQLDGLMFADATRETDLVDASYAMLGFGTQMLDAELDGWPDIVLTNGHVQDLTDQNIPYRMRPQLYRNEGGRFAEQPAESLGPFFAQEHVGRGLALLDWNRDGLEDFVVSHLHDPAALVVNQTEDKGHFVAVRLVGVTGSRDAIGATVRVRCGDRNWSRPLTAGDGYQASNQRVLVFGLGPHDAPSEITVDWSPGNRQTWPDVAVDTAITLVEGRAEVFVLP